VVNLLANSGNVSLSLYENRTFQEAFAQTLVSNLQSQCVRCQNASAIQLTMFRYTSGYFRLNHSNSSRNNTSDTSGNGGNGPVTAPVLTNRRRRMLQTWQWLTGKRSTSPPVQNIAGSVVGRASSTAGSGTSDGTDVAVALQVAADPADIPTVENRTSSGLLTAVLATSSNITNASMQVVARTAAFGEGAEDPFKGSGLGSVHSGAVSTGAIVGAVIGSVAGVLLAMIFAFMLWRRCRRQAAKQEALRTKAAAEAAARKYREQQSAMAAAAAAAQRLSSGSGRPIPPTLPQDQSAGGDAASRARYAGVVTLRELARTRILQGMMRIVQAAEAESNAASAALIRSDNQRKLVFLIVADRRALAVLSAACRLTDLIQEGAFVVESLESEREPLPRMSAVYFVAPELASFDRLVADFPDTQTAAHPSDGAGQRLADAGPGTSVTRTAPRSAGSGPESGAAGRLAASPANARTPRARWGSGAAPGPPGATTTASGPRYRAAHVFTTARVPDALLDLLRQSSCLVQRLLTFTELNLDFMAIEERIFSLDYPNALEMLFAPGSAAGHDDDHDGAALPGWASAWDARPAALQPPPGACSDMVQRIAQNLLTLCHLLGEVPTIRYQRSESGVAQSIAEALLDAIRDYEANVPGGMRGAQLQAAAVEQNASTAAAPSEDKSSAGTSTNTMLLILDRSVDMVAPFLHEYTYQAMCNDLLAADALDSGTTRYTYVVREGDSTASTTREAFLDEYADQTWARLRHLHIADAISEISEELQGSTVRSLGAALQGASAARNAPPESTAMPYEQMQKLSKYAVHMDILDCLMHRFNDRYLQRTSLCEQDLACGLVDCHGNLLSSTEAAQRISLILQDAHVPLEDKVRLLAIVLVTMDMSARDVDDLLETMEDVGLGRELVSALLRARLGVHLAKEPGECQALAERALRYFRASRGESYDLSRYVPFLREILEAIARDRLSRSRFPILFSAERESAGRQPPDDALTRGRSRSLSRERDVAGRVPTRNRAASVRRRRSSSVVRRRSDSADDLERGSGRELSSASEDEAATLNGTERISDSKRPRRRVVVFIAGGMCASEMRVSYEVSAELPLNVYLGATHVLTPTRMLEALRGLNRTLYAGEMQRERRPVSASEQRRGARSTPAVWPPPGEPSTSGNLRLGTGLASEAATAFDSAATPYPSNDGFAPRRRRSSSLSRFFSRRS